MRLLLALALAAATSTTACNFRKNVVSIASPDYEPAVKTSSTIEPVWDGKDLDRPRIAVALTQIADKLIQTADMQFVPGDPQLMIVLEKSGTAKWLDLASGKRGELFTVQVVDDSEQGLLGLAFHPQYLENGRFFVATTERSGDDDFDRLSEWTVPPGSDLRTAKPAHQRVLLEVKDPYQNHNGGQVVFGPDGFLYTAFGDGGWADDPHGHGQNTNTLLGDLLRIDVDHPGEGRAYAIPPDNPFVGREGHAPEIYAVGLRNPWRFSFDPRGRLIAGDVGQDRYEEIDLIEKGQNLGWNIREARHCFNPKQNCPHSGLTDPIFEYDRDDGGSVTGGFVALGKHVPALEGKYVFGDFLSGRLWALELPARVDPGTLARVHALGRWPILPSTFARDQDGRIYVADYPSGFIYRIDPPAER